MNDGDYWIQIIYFLAITWPRRLILYYKRSTNIWNIRWKIRTEVFGQWLWSIFVLRKWSLLKQKLIKVRKQNISEQRMRGVTASRTWMRKQTPHWPFSRTSPPTSHSTIPTISLHDSFGLYIKAHLTNKSRLQKNLSHCTFCCGN